MFRHRRHPAAVSGDDANPEEFATAKGPPLSVPPEFNLRPPSSGGGTKGEAAAAVAKKRLFNIPGAQAAEPAVGAGATPGEQAFLRQAGSASIDPNIRQVVDEETLRLDQGEEQLVDKLLKWRKAGPPEEERDGALTEEVADEISPVTIRKSKGLLGGAL